MKMKRFYTLVSFEKAIGGYHILLDGRVVKTKAGAPLTASNEAIAVRIMQEWADQKEQIIPDTMPFTQILNTEMDRVSRERAVITASVLKYLDTDLLCYPASDPPALVDLQLKKWGIWRDWFEKAFGCGLQTTTGLKALSQPVAAYDAVSRYIHGLDDAHFTVLQLMTSVSGSLILALAVVQGEATAQQVFDACYVEEHFKDTLYDAEKYGADPMLEKAQNAAMQDFKACQDYISLL